MYHSPMPAFSVSIADLPATPGRPAGAVLALSGEAGIAAAGELERQATALMARKPAFLVVDLSALTFLASLDIGILVSLARTVRGAGGEACIVGASGDVLEALRRTRVENLLPLFESLADLPG